MGNTVKILITSFVSTEFLPHPFFKDFCQLHMQFCKVVFTSCRIIHFRSQSLDQHLEPRCAINEFHNSRDSHEGEPNFQKVKGQVLRYLYYYLKIWDRLNSMYHKLSVMINRVTITASKHYTRFIITCEGFGAEGFLSVI
jgi:hypothetical protein